MADGYDRGAEVYEALWSPVILPPAAALVRLLGLTGRCVVADVGAGTGALLSAFRSAESQGHSPIRRLESLTVERQGDFVLIEVTANAFVHHMVRNIAGLLIAIGQGEKDPDWARSVLESKDRTQCGPTACAEGLYLWFVRYPRGFELPITRSVMINPLR